MALRLALREVKEINGFIKCRNVTFQKKKQQNRKQNEGRVTEESKGRQITKQPRRIILCTFHTHLFFSIQFPGSVSMTEKL